jgi:hypothetical protein
MSSHDQQHHRHLSGDFDELASLFAQRPADAASLPMQMMQQQQQQPWFFADYLQTPALDYGVDAFGSRDDFGDVPATPLEEVVKKEMQAVDAGMPGGGPGGTAAAPMTPHSVSLSSTSSEAGGGGVGGDEEGRCKKEDQGEGDESKEGAAAAAAKGGGDGQDKNKKG